jgi:hypothetical protein
MLKTRTAANGNSNTAEAAASLAAAAASPSIAVLADGQLGSSWKVIPGMGHDSCLMCTLMGHLANEPEAAGPVSVTKLLHHFSRSYMHVWRGACMERCMCGDELCCVQTHGVGQLANEPGAAGPASDPQLQSSGITVACAIMCTITAYGDIQSLMPVRTG